MNGHSLVEIAHMLHRIRSTIVNDECWLIESLRKSCPFNLVHEGRLGNLVQRLTHSVISQALARQALIPTFVMVLPIVGERLARCGFWPSSITSILSIIRGNVRVGGVRFRRAWRYSFFKWSISLCMAMLFCAWETWFLTWEWLLLVCVVCTLPSWSLMRSRLMKSSYR